MRRFAVTIAAATVFIAAVTIMGASVGAAPIAAPGAIRGAADSLNVVERAQFKSTQLSARCTTRTT
jgi:hypothetical protein